MNNSNENKTGETSPKFYSKDSARFIRQELSKALDILQGAAWVECNRQDRLCLDSAIEDVEEVYDKVTNFEEAAAEVDAIIKRIAS
jgi:hypothetical protein